MTDGAPNLEAALELCHKVLQPTLVVRSGYGLHAYWLFEAPLDIRDPDAREAAGELVAGWQRRMKQEAEALGFTLDATHDLARVFRPAGTFNTKGGEPVPVTLMDDGGPRYAVEAIDAEALAPVVKLVEPATAPGAFRKPDEIVARYAALGRIARHEGKAPGKGSDSEWDFYLACEARRRVKPPITRAEAIELVAHGRGYTGKGARADYLELTVDKAFGQVEAPDTVAPASADPAAVITAGWKIADDPIVAGWATGNGLAAIVFLRRKSGAVVRLRRLGDLFTANKHFAQVSVALGESIPHLTPASAGRIAQAVSQLCEVHDDDEVDRDEVAAWLGAFADGLGTIVTGDLHGEGAPRWRVLVAQRDFKPEESVHGIAASTAGVRDLEGRLWVPKLPLMRHVRKVEGAVIDWDTLQTRLADLGWAELRVDVHEPHSGTSKAGLRHISGIFYGEPIGGE